MHFFGFDNTWDQDAPAVDAPGVRPLCNVKKGDGVQVKVLRVWKTGTVEQVSDDLVHVVGVDGGAGTALVKGGVKSGEIRFDRTCSVGDKVDTRWGPKWYAGRVIELNEPNQVKVSYPEFNDSQWDQWFVQGGADIQSYPPHMKPSTSK